MLPASGETRVDLLGNPAPESDEKLRSPDSDAPLSYTTLPLARKIGIYGNLLRLQNMHAQTQSSLPESREIKLDYLLLKQEVMENLLIASAELNATVAEIEQEIASTNEIHAHLSERRDKAVRYNTYANFISGGITGIVGGSLNMNKNVSDLVPDIIDTFEGTIQTSLATWALKQQSGEKRMSQSVPTMLSNLINRTPESINDYPKSVAAYLSLSSDGGKTTTASKMVDRWYKLDLCLRHEGHKESRESRIKRINSATSPNQKLSIGVLEDRTAMLSDLRSTIAQMQIPLLELFQILNGRRRMPV